MYKLAVVDDEYLVRQAVRFILSEKKDIEICVEAEDGDSAIEAIKQTQPDVVLLDIKIPGHDGIQVAKEVKSSLPETKIIFLTAYDEFHYAQQSVKLGAYDFLLKPIEPEKIIEVMDRAMADMQKERDKKLEQVRVLSRLRELLPYIETEFVYHIITASGSPEELMREAELIGLKDAPAVVMIACVEETKAGTEIEKLLYYQDTLKEIKRIVSAIPSSLVAPIYNNKTIIILPAGFVTRLGNPKKELIHYAGKLASRLNSDKSCKISFGIGRVYKDIKDLSKSYLEAVRAQQQNILFSDSSVMHVDDIEPFTKTKMSYPLQKESFLIENVKQGKTGEALSILDSMLIDMLKPGPALTSLKNRLYEMLIILLRAVEESGVDSDKFFEEFYEKLNGFMGLQTAEELRSELRRIVKSVTLEIINYRNTRFNYLINLAIKHIEQNFNNDINLESVAEKISISSNYLSRLFLKETGMNFVEYLTNVRIEAAKRLLKTTTMSVEEIAFATGYKNPNYFSRVFKKTAGVTPTDYRNI